MNHYYFYNSRGFRPATLDLEPRCVQPWYGGYDEDSNKNWVYRFLDKIYRNVIPASIKNKAREKNAGVVHSGAVKSYNPVYRHTYSCQLLSPKIAYKPVMRGFLKFYILCLARYRHKRYRRALTRRARR